jgi:hypothetical protein
MGGVLGQPSGNSLVDRYAPWIMALPGLAGGLAATILRDPKMIQYALQAIRTKDPAITRHLGQGVEAMAHAVRLPTGGEIVVKTPSSARSLSGFKWEDIVQASDKLPYVVPTQVVPQEGRPPYLLQPLVQRRPTPGGNMGSRLRDLFMQYFDPAARAQGARGLRDIQGNIMYGTMRGRTRPWMPDIGSIVPGELTAEKAGTVKKVDDLITQVQKYTHGR